MGESFGASEESDTGDDDLYSGEDESEGGDVGEDADGERSGSGDFEGENKLPPPSLPNKAQGEEME